MGNENTYQYEKTNRFKSDKRPLFKLSKSMQAIGEHKDYQMSRIQTNRREKE